MKIGIDASRLTQEGRTGTENYLYFIVRNLAKIDKENKYVLFFKNDISNEFEKELFQGNQNFSYKLVKPFLSWTQVSLAVQVYKNNLDVLFCSWHTIPVLAIFSDTNIVSAVHDLTGKKIPTYLTIRFSNKLVAVSEYTKEQIVSNFHVQKRNINVISEGYSKKVNKVGENEIERIKQKYNIKGDYIFFLGTVGARKNMRRMISAYKKIKDKYNIEFVVAGAVKEGYKDVIKGIKYIGRVSDEDLSGLYSGAEFLSFVSEEEGFGLPILEAMRCGTPVLTSNITATKEVAGNAALLVDPYSVEEIKDGMEKLLSNKNIREKLKKRGYENLNKYSWEKAARELMVIFESL